MNKIQLGKYIKLARKDAGLTSERLSEQCGINAAYLRQIESGAKVPSLPVFVALCRGLRVSPSYLLSDILPGCGNPELDALIALCKEATPQQIRIIVAALEAFLKVTSEEA